MLLEVPLEEIPDSLDSCNFETSSEQADAIDAWLEEAGFPMKLAEFHLLRTSVTEEGLPIMGLFRVNVPILVTGRSPRGYQHVIVRDVDGTLYDPHPEQNNLEVVDGFIFLAAKIPR